ncbi:MAG: hypothetical protein C5B51_19620 [Terriglobia bacterium]|nr:MAG: hypothetical protein C5B51_19620 [Terriglobia bacterium]
MLRTQEQALRLYYASMGEAELLHAAQNRSSFIALAQRLLTEELERRHLTSAPEVAHEAQSEPSLGLFRFAGRLRHAFHHHP